MIQTNPRFLPVYHSITISAAEGFDLHSQMPMPSHRRHLKRTVCYSMVEEQCYCDCW
jgi:hypothetical protein